MTAPPLELTTVVSAPFQENCYIVWLAGRHDCLVVDPGLEPDKILDTLERLELSPAAILNTHGHCDHVAGNGPLKQRWPDCVLVIGHREAEKLTDPRLNLSADFGASLTSPPADRLVREGERFSAAGIDLWVREIPGHSAGHVVYVYNGHQPPVVFVGDVIFAQGIGRTDFPDGNFQLLAQGIHQKLFSLPDDTVLLSGHGASTTVGREKRENPFVGLGS
ncbi:MAG TPA: MBL fold metallo-hydrolase [Planctomycetaceae bacterium]|nr:MBL fold metallo-hydrolase [Planctomycetaceae bacterium]HIQ22518.1 MBL fold metallo-hydrolase [Planctomycetota bacterium]